MIKINWFKLNLMLLPIMTYIFICDIIIDLSVGITWITLVKAFLIVFNILELNAMLKNLKKN